jgi:molybdopterin-binding protein
MAMAAQARRNPRPGLYMLIQIMSFVCLAKACILRPVFPFYESRLMTIQSINARNQFHGTIKEIILGSVVSEIEVETPFGVVTSVITTRSVKDLDLRVGTEVLALVKSTEVSIAKL